MKRERNGIFSMFDQYRGLRKEMYVLFFGRMMTNMGSIIMPMMSMILANKMGMSAQDIAIILLMYGVVQGFGTIIGGKLADKFNKRNIIVCFDIITVVAYIVAGMLPLGFTAIILLFVGALFATMEWPSFDALVADFSQINDRERAYSLSYLGANLGFVIAPIVGGFLFANYLNIAFIFNGIATLSSTILIFFLIKDMTKEISPESTYEGVVDGKVSVLKIIFERKTVLLFLVCSSFMHLLYSEFNFLIPLNLELLYGEQGAKYFGLITSLNAVVVIFGTPFVTTYFRKIMGVWKLVIGETFIVISFFMYVFIQGLLPLYFVAMTIFTIGEVFSTLGNQPYLTKRVPMTHRGRISSVRWLVCGAVQTVSQVGIGYLLDTIAITKVWLIISCIGLVSISLLVILAFKDKKAFPKLYESGFNIEKI